MQYRKSSIARHRRGSQIHLDSRVREVGCQSSVDSDGDLAQLHSASSIKGASSKPTANVKDMHVEAQSCALVKHLETQRD